MTEMLAIDLREDEGASPKTSLPPGACDTHSHIYGPEALYPHVPGRQKRYSPIEAYQAMRARTGITRSVIVQPSLYGYDNRCTLAAIEAIGLEHARGTAVVAPDTPIDELKRLHAGGIRGIRISYNGDELSPESAHETARAIAPLDWVIQVQDAREAWIADAASFLSTLPVPLIFDHFGRTPATEGASSSEFKAMVKLLESGNVWVKLSGAYYSSADGPPDFADVAERIRILIDARPDRLLFGLNWPFPDYPGRPADGDAAHILDLLAEWVPDEDTRQMILVRNPDRLYGFSAH